MDSKVKIEIVDGPGGYSLYINDTRVAGPKPLGGGRLVKAFGVKADELISLLDAQRCEWKDDGYGDYAAQCGGYFSFDHDIVDDKYCPHCGRRIEVKDVEKG